MAEAAAYDDLSVPSTTAVLRRIPATAPNRWVVADERLGDVRPSTQAFKDNRNGPKSVFIEDECGGAATADLQSALAHVVFMGGGIGAGKSSITRLLAEKYGLLTYHYDRLQRDHYARLRPDRHPTMVAALQMSEDGRWVFRSGDEMARATVAWHAERFEMVVEDLRALPWDRGVIAEGFGLLPHLVAPLLTSLHQAIWLISTRDFRHRALVMRGMGNPASEWPRTSDPERAQRNKDDRDELLAQAAGQTAHALGLAVLEVDGTASIDEVTAAVEQHFAPLLPPR